MKSLMFKNDPLAEFKYKNDLPSPTKLFRTVQPKPLNLRLKQQENSKRESFAKNYRRQYRLMNPQKSPEKIDMTKSQQPHLVPTSQRYKAQSARQRAINQQRKLNTMYRRRQQPFYQEHQKNFMSKKQTHKKMFSADFILEQQQNEQAKSPKIKRQLHGEAMGHTPSHPHAHSTLTPKKSTSLKASPSSTIQQKQNIVDLDSILMQLSSTTRSNATTQSHNLSSSSPKRIYDMSVSNSPQRSECPQSPTLSLSKNMFDSYQHHQQQKIMLMDHSTGTTPIQNIHNNRQRKVRTVYDQFNLRHLIQQKRKGIKENAKGLAGQRSQQTTSTTTATTTSRAQGSNYPYYQGLTAKQQQLVRQNKTTARMCTSIVLNEEMMMKNSCNLNKCGDGGSPIPEAADKSSIIKPMKVKQTQEKK